MNQIQIFIDNKKIKITKDAYFVFGLGRDRKTMSLNYMAKQK